jgi:biotin carboxyl carrier protein
VSPLGPRRIRIVAAPGRPAAPDVVVGLAPDADPRTGPWLVDGRSTAAQLEPRGPGRAVIVGPEGRADLLVLPASSPAPGVVPGRSDADPATRLELIIDGWRLEVAVEDATRATLRDKARRGRVAATSAPPAEVRAIIPGRVAAVAVAPGDAVSNGQGLLVVEAMKMQNELRAPRAGTVARVAVVAGQTVEAGALLVVIE